MFGREISSPIDVLGPDGAERLRGGLVTPNFFDTLGVNAARGRLFGLRDNDAEPFAVISDGYWRRRFGADSRIVLVETGILVGAGGAAGVTLALALQPVLRALVPAALTRGDETSIDVPVLAFAAGLCALLTLICGLAPLWHVSTRSAHDRLKRGGSQMSASRGVALWRRAILTMQVALVLVLLVSAALLLHSVWRLRHVDLGHDGSDVLTMEMFSLLPTTWSPGWLPRFQRDLLARVQSLPGVTEASLTSSVPMRGGNSLFLVGPVGRPVISVDMRTVDARYFDVMRIPILAIRNALGADGRLLVRQAVTQKLRPVLTGTLLGFFGAFWLSRLLQRFLFEVSPLDPWAYGVASSLLVAVAFVGRYSPARRVTRIDPATALRAE